MRRVSVVLGSLVGAVAIHGLLVACGSSGSASAVRDANAQGTTAPAASACGHWAVSYFFAPNVASEDYVSSGANTFPAGLGKSIAVPAGWEPMGALIWPGDKTNDDKVPVGALVSVRHCTDGE